MWCQQVPVHTATAAPTLGQFHPPVAGVGHCIPHEAQSPPPYNVSPATKTIGTHQQVYVWYYTCVEGVWLAVLVQY